jgi:hypothetical protein
LRDTPDEPIFEVKNRIACSDLRDDCQAVYGGESGREAALLASAPVTESRTPA